MAVNWMSVLSTRSTVTIPRTSGWTLSVNMLNTSIVTLSVFSVPNGKRATAQVPIPNPSGSATPYKKIIPVTELAWWDCTTHQIEFHHSNSVAIGIIFTLMSSRICAHITDAKNTAKLHKCHQNTFLLLITTYFCIKMWELKHVSDYCRFRSCSKSPMSTQRMIIAVMIWVIALIKIKLRMLLMSLSYSSQHYNRQSCVIGEFRAV